MPLEQLEKLFESVGQAAEQFARLKQEQHVVMGGRVAISEAVSSVSDLYRQIGRSVPATSQTDQRQGSAPAQHWREIIEQLRTLITELKEARPKQTKAEHQREPPLARRLAQYLPPNLLEAGIKLGDYIAKQERAGRAVDRFTLALAIASRFLYSLTTGRVITPAGLRLPWRRALARSLRRFPATRSLRRILMAPDLVLRRTQRHIAQALQEQSRPAVRRMVRGVRELRQQRERLLRPAPRAESGMALQPLGQDLAAAGVARLAAGGASRAAVAEGAAAAGLAAGAAAAGGAAAGAGAGIGAGAAAAGGAAAGAGAGIGAGAAAAGGAAAGGAAAMGAATIIGAVVAVLTLLVVAIIATIVAMRKFTTMVRDAAEAMLQARFAKYAEFSPQIAYAKAKYEAYDIQHRIREGAATGPATLALTQSLIELRREMGPMNRALLNLQLIGMRALVNIARGINAILKITRIVELLEIIAGNTKLPTPPMETPAQTFLTELEKGMNIPRNPIPGGLPPWQ